MEVSCSCLGSHVLILLYGLIWHNTAFDHTVDTKHLTVLSPPTHDLTRSCGMMQ